MFSQPNMPTDAALARLSENDLYEEIKVALAALNEARNSGQSTSELSKIYQTLEAENERRTRNRSLR